MSSAVQRPAPPGGDDLFSLDAELGRDLAAIDWAATPLGPPRRWPQSLRAAVSILLSSRFPMWMAYGPQLTFFCNAAYRRDTLGRKYPWALGRPASEVWAEIWADIGPRIDTVLSTGKATWDEALLLFLERSGYREETYHTFSYSPLRDDDGALTGMLCVVSEDTERVVGERRMATLRDLGSDLSVVRTEQEMLAFASEQLGRNLRDLPFTLTYLFEPDGHAWLAASTGIRAGRPAAPSILTADGSGDVWPAARLARQEPVLMDLDGPPFRELPIGDWPEPPNQALLVPLPRQGAGPYGFLVAALNRYRPLNDGYRGFVELTAGHVATGIGSARSYRVQQRRAEELAELDRAKTAFFSNISHEFRTPLTLIMGPVQELRDRLPPGDQRARDEVEVIHRSGLRLGKLVNTLLDFSRIEAGRVQARYEPVDLPVFTAELASVFRAAIERAGLAFEVDCPPLDRPVYVDRGMWEKVVLNLLSNALKFTFDGGIRVSLDADGDHAVVRVSDSGVGVPVDEMPRLFERFHRVPSARARSNEGSGIGLALVQELVHLHGGTIAAQSEPDSGTTFTIRLPYGHAHLPADQIAETTGSHAATETAEPFVQEALRWLPEDAGGSGLTAPDTSAVVPATAAVDGPRARVLVADDNTDMRDYLRRLLTGQYEVITVADGAAALAAARNHPPDLIVSDVMMPGLGGLELVTALRAEPRTAGVPVMLLSARAGQEAAVEGLSAGADDYLVKPFAAQEFLARVRGNVDLARLRNHHSQWRTALIDSLQEGFFVADADGTIVEVNSAFTDILGYPADGLPYPAPHPWWPDPHADSSAHEQVTEAYRQVISAPHGSTVVPLRHRDGHRLWATLATNSVRDDRGTRMMVGTIRDVTTERYAAARDTALNAMNECLASARTVPEVLQAAVTRLRRQWLAPAVFARAGAATVSAPTVGAPTVGAPTVGAPTVGAATVGAVGVVRDADADADPPAAMDGLRDVPQSRILIESGGGGRPIGAGTTVDSPVGPVAIWLTLDPARGFGTEDQTLLLLLCGSLAQALHRAHAFDQQREVAVTLQRAILGPVALPDGFAVRYQPALEVGGDWYDAVDLPDGRIGIMVGDCVGRGLSAATVMGQLRSAGRALLLRATGPSEVLTALDQFAVLLPEAICTTALCAILDPGNGQLVYSSAGHPPAILTLSDGRTELLAAGLGLPLGVLPGRPRQETNTVVPPGAVLLLYTDGLIERRRRPLEAGIARAAETVRDYRALPVEQLADRLLSQMTSSDGYSDDVALLLYRHPAPLDIAFDADAGVLAPARTVLRAWLRRAGVDSRVTQNVLVAAGEACANAIEHGNRDAHGRIHLVAATAGEDIQVTVADTGRWLDEQTSENRYRGNGIRLMRALMNHVDLRTGPTGTTVTMSTRITP
ncbi:SpoIIE family protein phosphatase [Rugosimonospora africana]|uniref:histidine kinase n=1 Tax=Rugosimonospora africana TaxID=556532 RepID=A0A8J3VVD1_9ACTN|nr:SpoIIE family protein phosphatase [Rugosimonospora africana]GIH19809.1 histidine kinase [Rugosimonospora africana]